MIPIWNPTSLLDPILTAPILNAEPSWRLMIPKLNPSVFLLITATFIPFEERLIAPIIRPFVS